MFWFGYTFQLKTLISFALDYLLQKWVSWGSYCLESQSKALVLWTFWEIIELWVTAMFSDTVRCGTRIVLSQTRAFISLFAFAKRLKHICFPINLRDSWNTKGPCNLFKAQDKTTINSNNKNIFKCLFLIGPRLHFRVFVVCLVQLHPGIDKTLSI